MEKVGYENNLFKVVCVVIRFILYLDYSSLPSSRPDGQRVLITGLWGVVRQPHYLGEIIIALSWCCLCGKCHFTLFSVP